MKKIVLITAALLLAVSARAQLVVGGNIGITSGAGGNGVGIYLAPEVGYCFANQLYLGGKVSYRSADSSFGLTPYTRWNFVNIANRVSFHIGLDLPMNFSPNYQSYAAYARPGISVRVSDTVWLMAQVGNFGYQYANVGGTVICGWRALCDWNNVSIGVCIGI